MLEELRKVIEANLPSEVGKTLQNRLAEAEKLEVENGKLKKENSDLDDQNQALKSENAALKGKSDSVWAQGALNVTKDSELTTRENKLERTLAELRAAESEKRAEGLKEVLGIVFKSPVYRRSYTEQNDGNSVTDYVNGQTVNKPTNFPYMTNTKEEITNE